jgi:UPF0755 protein
MKKVILIIILGILLVGGFFAFNMYQKVFVPNVNSDLPNDGYVLIPTNSSFEEIATQFQEQGIIKNQSSFEWTAQQMKYAKNPMRAGRYKIEPNWSNRTLITHLRGGLQAPVRMTVHNKWAIEDVAGLLASQLEADSLDFVKVFLDEDFLAQYGLNKETAMTAFIPDTYDFYWNTSPKKLFSKMVSYRDKFWNEGRLAKAKKLGLTKEEVYTMASIVEKETNKNDEKDRVAGVYYNRLRKGMRLEADPTAKFASGNYKLSRVLYSHLEIDSPYNTYKYAGLPPGPIYMSSQSSIDKTLDLENHNYIYFCAKPGGTGYHAFAKSYRQHLNNAAKYHAYSRLQRQKNRK